MDYTALGFILILAYAGWAKGNPEPPTITETSPPTTTTEESILMGELENSRIPKTYKQYSVPFQTTL